MGFVLLCLPWVISGVRVARCLVLSVLLCRSLFVLFLLANELFVLFLLANELFVLFLLANELFVLGFTASDYTFDVFKYFFCVPFPWIEETVLFLYQDFLLQFGHNFRLYSVSFPSNMWHVTWRVVVVVINVVHSLNRVKWTCHLSYIYRFFCWVTLSW